MRTLRLVPLFLCLAITQPAFAEHYFFNSGNKFVEYMREYEKEERGENGAWSKAGIYIGYVAGVHDQNFRAFCKSKNVSLGQVTAIVAKYLREHPEKWDRPAFALVTAALRGAFPCGSSTK